MQRFQLYIVMVLAPLFLSGCVTTYSTSKVSSPQSFAKETVYVTNQDHEAYGILERAKIYDMTNDETHPKQLTILDFSNTTPVSCGLGIIATYYSLGFVPFQHTRNYGLSYRLNDKNFMHELEYQENISTWGIVTYPFLGSERNAQIRALSKSNRSKCLTSCDELRANTYDPMN